jgi:RNA polymerase sigma-70 factor (ECF subfamily)
MGDGEGLRTRFEDARRAWPKVVLAEAKFVAYLRARAPDPGSIAALHADELYLACACVEGQPAAIAELENVYLADVRKALARMKLGALQDDAMQLLRQRLLMRDGGRAPRLADYAGRGALKGWLRVTAVRLVLDELDRKKPEILVEDTDQLHAATLAAQPDLELGPVNPEQRALFKQAFERAFMTLAARQQNLLRQQVVDGLSIDDLGALYHVHRATAARWLKEIRSTLVYRTREEMQSAGLTRSACDQILTRAQSQLDLSLSRLFAATPRERKA